MNSASIGHQQQRNQFGAGGAVGIGGIGGIVPDEKPQIAQLTDRIDHCLQELHHAMEALSARLGPVLNPEYANQAQTSNTAVPQPVRSPLGNDLDRYADNIFAATDQLRGLLTRLAL